MNGGPKSGGYTIVEVLIVLAVTGSLFLMAMIFINGRQAETEFNQGIRDAQARIDTVVTQVANGVSVSSGNISCNVTAGTLSISAGATNPGTNGDCVMMGKVIKFTHGADYHIFTVVGARQDGDREVTNFAASKATAPTALDSSGTFGYGMQVTKVVTTKSPSYTNKEVGAIGFFGAFGSYDMDDNLESSQKVLQLPLPISNLADSIGTTRTNISGIPLVGDGNVKPDNTVVCFVGGNGTRAALVIGANNTGASTELHIGDVDSATIQAMLGGSTCPAS